MRAKRVRIQREDWIAWGLNDEKKLNTLLRRLGVDPKVGYAVETDRHGDKAVYQVESSLPDTPIDYEDLIPKEKP